MTSERRWRVALADHNRAVEAFVATIQLCPLEAWHREPAPGKWSPAALTLHVTDAYEMGSRAVAGGSSMRLRIPRWRAWLLRKTLLPAIIRKGELPRVRAPREIQPDLEMARNLTPAQATERLRNRATAAAEAFQAAAKKPGAPRMIHAYFGALRPLLALRFLTAHTMHHTKGFVRLLAGAG